MLITAGANPLLELIHRTVGDEGADDAALRAVIGMKTPALSEAAIGALREMLREMQTQDYNYYHRCREARKRLYSFTMSGRAKRSPSRYPAYKFMALLELNALLLHHRFGWLSEQDEDDLIANCKDLVGAFGARDAVSQVYLRAAEASESDGARRAFLRNEWQTIDFSTATFLAAGTTSLILKFKTKPQRGGVGATTTGVLKCVQFPWADLSRVSRDTTAYATRYGRDRVRHVGGVEEPRASIIAYPTASASCWVMMEFLPGMTLADYVAAELRAGARRERPDDRDSKRRKDRESIGVATQVDTLSAAKSNAFAVEHVPPAHRLQIARKVALAIVLALEGMAENAPLRGADIVHQHLDLSPTNIIVDPAIDGSTISVKFIDLGINHLYSRQIGIAEHDDSAFVSGEVKRLRPSATSDVYSLAVIVASIVSGTTPHDGKLSDIVYEVSPALGRVLDEALEQSPSRRLLLFHREAELDSNAGDLPLSYARYHEYLSEAFELIEREPEASNHRLVTAWSKYAPSSAQPITFLRQIRRLVMDGWRSTKADSPDETSSLWKRLKDTFTATHRNRTRYLSLASLLVVAASWSIYKESIGSLWPALTESLHNRLTLKHGALVIAYSQGLTASKYYQTIFSRVSARRTGHLLTGPTEFLMRTVGFVAVPTVCAALWWTPLWVWSCALGASWVTLTNLSVVMLTRRIYSGARARGFSALPFDTGHMPGSFEAWWGSMLVYAAILFLIAGGISLGKLHDRGAYVLGLVMVSILIHYVGKCTVDGPRVRGGIARALALGERSALYARRPARWIGDNADIPVAHDQAAL